MARICFVSYEIHPTTWGGCGVLLHNIARLLLADGHEVIFLLDVGLEYFERFQNHDRLDLPSPDHCRAYQVDSLCRSLDLQPDDFAGIFDWKAYRFHHACRQVYAQEHPNIIEFFDYCGVGHYALSAKAAGLDYADARLAIRLHNSLEIIDHFEPTKPLTLERYSLYALEHSALRLAETILYPSQSYLDQAYKPFYEPWLGDQKKSAPPLINFPTLMPASADSDIVLFYGRLFAFKGVDVFVDAAVAYLNRAANPRLMFYLAGYDSGAPPVGQGSYQAYLWQKIPVKHRQQFQFTGQLNWEQLRDLSPRIRFGVFPSYFESFCYAAQELYAAAVPIIVADIPGFRDYFRHETNALVCDGSVGSLALEMERLSTDHELRQRIKRPYPVAGNRPGDFYSTTNPASWMCAAANGDAPQLLVVVIGDEDANHLKQTMAALDRASIDALQIVVCRPTDLENDTEPAAFILGAKYVLVDCAGRALEPTAIRTADAIVLFRAGDAPEPEYLTRCLEILARHPPITYVGSWKKITAGARSHLQTYSIETMPETLPFVEFSFPSRYVLRTPRQRLLIDLFDANAGQYGEVAYLWQLEADAHYGLTIPAALMTVLDQASQETDFNLLPYIILKASSSWQRVRLANLVVPLWQFMTQDQHSSLQPPNGQINTTHVREVMAVYGSIDWKILWMVRRFRRRVEGWLSRYRTGQRLLGFVYGVYKGRPGAKRR